MSRSSNTHSLSHLLHPLPPWPQSLLLSLISLCSTHLGLFAVLQTSQASFHIKVFGTSCATLPLPAWFFVQMFKFLKATCPPTHIDKNSLLHYTWFLLCCFSSYFASYYSPTSTTPYNSLRFIVDYLISSTRIESLRGQSLCRCVEE